MKIELDSQEREFIRSHAKTMMTLFRREMSGRNATGADAMTVAFFERLAQKMEGMDIKGIEAGRRFIGNRP